MHIFIGKWSSFEISVIIEEYLLISPFFLLEDCYDTPFDGLLPMNMWGTQIVYTGL